MPNSCSIPGCSGKNRFLKLNKLFRVPAVAVGDSGLIFNLTNKRRKRWFVILEKFGLTKENSDNYRVCANHFQEGKPAPMFDSKSLDWVPNQNLPGCEKKDLVAHLDMEAEDKRKRGRPRKKKDLSKSEEQDISVTEDIESENESMDSERSFVFVDVKKIKETSGSTTEQPPVGSKHRSNSSRRGRKSGKLRSFATQTNPNVLPPLKWGHTKLKKLQDPRYQSVGVQTEFPNGAVSQECAGQMIDYIRMHMLEFQLKALGCSFRLKECSLHFQNEEVLDKDSKSISTLSVYSNRLLSENSSLLESVAMSLDLHRLHQKNQEDPNFLWGLCGKTETILSKSEIQKVSGRPEVTPCDQEGLSINSLGESYQAMNSSSCEESAIFPVVPKITNVMSLSSDKSFTATGELAAIPEFDNDLDPAADSVSETQRKRRNTSTESNDTPRKIQRTVPRILARKKIVSVDEQEDVECMLGTSQIPKVILPKLPDSILESASNGNSIPLKEFSNVLKDICPTTNELDEIKTEPCSPPALPPPTLWVQNFGKPAEIPSTLLMTQDSEHPALSIKNVKNIPLKLSETKDVAGYLLLPNTSAAGTPAPIYYVPKVAPDQGLIDNRNVGLEGLLVKSMPGTPILLTGVPSNMGSPISVVSELKKPIVALPNSPSAVSIGIPFVSPTENTNLAVKPLGKLLKPECGVLPSMESTKIATTPDKNKVKNKSPRRKEIKNSGHEEKTNETKKENVVNDEFLRCPYCKKQCANGVEFVNHHRSAVCRNVKMVPASANQCEKCKNYYRKDTEHDCTKTRDFFQDCNVCGRIFSRSGHLANHVKTHVEYTNWTEKCSKCPKKFPNKEVLDEHFAKWHFEKVEYPCEQCDIKFLTKKTLRAHMEKVHGQNAEGLFDMTAQKKDFKVVRGVEKPIEKRKPTAIRSKPFEGDDSGSEFNGSIEAELSRMFHDSLSESDYEMEEVLSDYKNEVNVTSRIKENVVNVGIRTVKPDIDPEESFTETVSDIIESSADKICEPVDDNSSKKLDIKSLLNMEGSNDISIEEVDEEFFSS